MSRLEQMRLASADLAQNPAPRLAVCICVDASYSMRKDSRIHQVNQGIRRFIQEIAADQYAVDSIELCVISFGADSAKVVHSFAPVTKIDYQDIIASGQTPMGQAVAFALEELQTRKNNYDHYGITTYKPWLILLSDGESTDDIRRSSKHALQMQKEDLLKVLCIGLGTEANDLADFQIDRQVIQLKDFALDHFFAWLSKSMSMQSKESPSFDFGIPNSDGLTSLIRKDRSV